MHLGAESGCSLSTRSPLVDVDGLAFSSVRKTPGNRPSYCNLVLCRVGQASAKF